MPTPDNAADKLIASAPTPDATADLLVDGAGSGGVDSVNGQTGTVVLTAEDVGAITEDAALLLFDRGVVSGYLPVGIGASGGAPAFSPPAIAGGVQSYVRMGNEMFASHFTTIVGVPGHATQPRIDAIVVEVSGGGGFVNPHGYHYDQIVVQGTPSVSPAPPDITSAQILLAYVAVPALAADSSACTITDERSFVPGVGPTTAHIAPGSITTTQIGQALIDAGIIAP